MKLLNEEIAENSKNKQRKSMAGIIDSVDPIEVERINAVYDKIPKEEQLRFTKVGSNWWIKLSDDDMHQLEQGMSSLMMIGFSL